MLSSAGRVPWNCLVSSSRGSAGLALLLPLTSPRAMSRACACATRTRLSSMRTVVQLACRAPNTELFWVQTGACGASAAAEATSRSEHPARMPAVSASKACPSAAYLPPLRLPAQLVVARHQLLRLLAEYGSEGGLGPGHILAQQGQRPALQGRQWVGMIP